jgi:hypothetical protein
MRVSAPKLNRANTNADGNPPPLAGEGGPAATRWGVRGRSHKPEEGAGGNKASFAASDRLPFERSPLTVPRRWRVTGPSLSREGRGDNFGKFSYTSLPTQP